VLDLALAVFDLLNFAIEVLFLLALPSLLRLDLDPSFTRIVPPPLATVVVSNYGSFDQPVTVQLPNQFAQHLLVATDVNNGDFSIRP